MDKSFELNTGVSLILENDVPIGQESEFRQWQSAIREASYQFEGYLGTVDFPPIPGIRNKWYVVLYFDTPENLTRWLESDVRQNLIKNRQKNLGSYRFVHYQSSFEGWSYLPGYLEQPQSNLSLWKQNLAVLFGLYPTVMIETLVFSHFKLMDSWSLPNQMFINNLVSCSLLTWLVMPIVRQLFNFWLKPDSDSLQNDWGGMLLIMFGLGLMVSLFNTFV